MNRNSSLAILNIVGFVFVVTMNTLAVLLPLNGKSTGELSDQYPNLFTPAGFTFSIWGLIYLFLLGFTIYQAMILFGGKKGEEKLQSISPLFLFNCFLNGAWIFAWHHEWVSLSVLIMLLLLFSLIAIHNRLALPYDWQPLAQKLFLDIPFSIYLGWISIATIANVTAWLTDRNLQPMGLPQSTWAIIMIAVGTLLALLMLWKKQNIFFTLVPAWAFYGIAAKRLKAGDEASLAVASVAKTCIYIILLAILILITVRLLNQRKTRVQVKT